MLFERTLNAAQCSAVSPLLDDAFASALAASSAFTMSDLPRCTACNLHTGQQYVQLAKNRITEVRRYSRLACPLCPCRPGPVVAKSKPTLWSVLWW